MLETDETISDVFIQIKTSNSLTKMKKNVPQFGVTSIGKRSCYIYNLPKKDQDEDIIVSTNVYSGNATLAISYWSLPKEKKDFQVIYNLDDYDVSRLLAQQRNIHSQSFGDIFFCIYAETTTSYFLNVFLENEIEKNQARNYLVAGNNFVYK
jgi:hypothetical protein